MTFDLGDTIPLGITVRDDAQALVDATSVDLTITQPDGVVVTPVPLNPSTGIYTLDFLPAQVGRHLVRWATTGPTTAYSDSFNVRPADMGSILSLKEAKEALNKSPENTRDDEEVRRWLATASEAVESIVGAVSRRAVVEDVEVEPDTRWVALAQYPLISVEAVTLEPGAYPGYVAADLVLRRESGLVRLATDTCWPCSLLRFSYTVGRAVVNESIRSATAIILQHLWETQRGWQTAPTARGEAGGAAAGGATYAGFAIPNRAVDLLQPSHGVVIA